MAKKLGAYAGPAKAPKGVIPSRLEGRIADTVQKARAEARGVGEAPSRLRPEAGSRNKVMKPVKLGGSKPVFAAKHGGKAKKSGGKCK